MFLDKSVFRSCYFLPTLASMAIWATLTSNSHARLGETAQECVDRYGKPVEVVRDTPGLPCSMVFLIPGQGFDNKRVRCFFDTPKPTAICNAVVYNNFGHDLEVMENMLELNSEGSKWLNPELMPNASLGIMNYNWQREDGATAQNHGAGMWIWGKEATQRQRDNTRKELQDRVKGL